MQRRRVMSLLLAVIMAWCATSGLAQAKVQVQFWHALGGHIGSHVLQGFVDEFNTSQDRVHVEAIYQGNYDDTLNKYRLAVQAGETPHLVHVYEIGTRLMIDLQSTVSLQPFIDRGDVELEHMVANVLAYYTIDDQLYSMPFNTSNAILYYNKDMFRAAGLDPEQSPKTFEEFREYAQRMTGNGKHGFGNYAYGWYFEQLMAIQNAEYVNNGNGRLAPATEAAFNGEAGVRILEWLSNMKNDGSYLDCGRDSSALRSAFVAGNVGMRIGSTGGFASTLADIDDRFEMGAAFLPVPEGIERGGVVIGGGSIWMSKDHPQEEIEAAWEFLRHLTTPESTAYWHVNTGYFPIDRRAMELDNVKQLHTETPHFRTAIDQLEASRISLATQGAVIGVFPEARKAIEVAMEQVLLGMASPQAALDEAAEEVTAAIRRYNIQRGF
ncbi:MAG: ABC transporter substrate-binding protein [Firmicutes bacterium]|nr:ABC transporter substrate-binding protein [Bacillota bacterium]